MISIAERASQRRSKDKRISYNETQLWKRTLQDSSSDEPSESDLRNKRKTRIETRNTPKKNYNEDDDDDEDEEDYESEDTDEEDYDETEDVSSDSSRKKNKKKGASKSDGSDEYDEDEDYEEEDDDELIVQAILGKRDDYTPAIRGESEKKEAEEGETDKYYVKFVDKAYIHCQWLTEKEIKDLEGGEAALQKFQRKMKRMELSPSISIENLLTFDDSEVNSVWFEIDRIIDDRRDENNSDDEDVEFRVKWQSLDYTESTWEKKEDIKDQHKIDEYYQRIHHSNPTKIPSRWKRPDPSKFVPLEEAPPSKNGDELRDYQMDGLNWLRSCWFNKMNNILADEMGLGKTAQIVRMLSDLSVNEGIDGPFLVVAPLSTLNHWRNEFEKWSELNTVIYHGNQQCRDLIRQLEFTVYNDKGRVVPDRVQFDVLVTNYDTIQNEFSIFEKIEWRYVVFDEAHRLKNPRGKLYQKIERLAFEHCTMLTGTPIQNNMEELWGLLHLLHPDRFDNLEEFNEKYGDMNNSEQVKQIQAIIKPLMLRRKKADVEKSIAPKEETIVNVELTRVQKKFYKAFLSDNAGVLLNQITGGALNSLQNLMMQLRKVCNHPYLITGAEESIVEDKKKEETSQGKSKEEIELDAMIMSSGKLVFIDKLLPKLQEGHHKVLIFSQMVRVLTIIERFLIARNYKYERIDGSIGENERATAIDRFNQDPDEFVFLLSTRAGGVGINLTAADTVIIYDSDWNPQNDIQAEARCHRIGQTQKVKVYRLITRGTYESKMFERASKKLGLDHVVLDGGDMSKDQPMKAQEIEEMLRYGVANMFNDDDTKADEFTSEDIDQILSRRATVTVNDVITGGESIFAKASFNADGDNLDLNSTDFWSQVLPQARTDMSDIPTMRRCKANRIERSASIVDNDILKSIRSLQSNGYTGEGSQMIVLRESFRISDPKFEGDGDALKLITKDFPEGDQNEVEKMLGEYGFNIKDGSDKVITRCAFFYRLKRALFFAQRPEISWPCITPAWENPYHEYALMVGVQKYGFAELESIIDDDDMDLKDAQPLTKQKIERRVRNLFEAIEKQYSDELNIEIPGDFVPSLPKEWKASHPNLLSRENLYDNEILSLIQVVCALGIPMVGENIDVEKLQKEAKLTFVTPKAIQDVCDDLNDLAVVVADEEKEERKEREKEREEEKKKEKEREMKEDGLRRSARIRENEREKERAQEKEKEREESKDKDKEPYDLSSFSHLKPINGKLTRREAKKIKSSIEDMHRIYKFVSKFGKRRTEIMKNAPKYNSAPEWWSWECDRALILAINNYGQNSFSQWIADKQGPFRVHIPQELVAGFDEAAEAEAQKQRAIRPQEIGEFQFLYNQRSRISRALAVITYISKELSKQKKQKEKEEKKAKKEGSQSGKGSSVLTFKGQLKIISLGKILNQRRFVKKDIVYPVGYVSHRRFRMNKSKDPKYWYKCEIEERDGKPIFTVETIDNPEHGKFESDDINNVWRLVIDFLAKGSTEKQTMIRGAGLFGLQKKEVKEELAKLPGAEGIECLIDKPKVIDFTIPLEYVKPPTKD